MLQAIAILGGWLLMMGQHDRSESLFYYFRIEDQVPQNHLLRFIDRYVSFDFVREKLRASYSETGRPSIDPEVLLRILLLGYLYGITSERKLLEELRMHLDAVVTGTCLTWHISHALYRNLHVAENRLRRTQAQSGVFAGDPFPCPQNPPRFTPRGGSTPPPGTSTKAASDAGSSNV
jgi:hypothetical protein